MKKYFLNSGTMKLHNINSQDARCKTQTHNENIQRFNTLEEAKQQCDNRIKLCKICMKNEIAQLGKPFLD